MYFPRPYPDELVGSLLLRACRHTGLPMYAIVSRLSYHGCGHRTLFRSGLFAQLSSAIHLPATEIVEQHTLFPYITRFVKDSRRKALLASASSLSAQSVLQFGHFAKRVCYACRGRYCPVCAAADLAQFGETYWHRLHCLPGMRLCPYHRCALVSHVYSGRPDGKETTPPPQTWGTSKAGKCQMRSAISRYAARRPYQATSCCSGTSGPLGGRLMSTPTTMGRTYFTPCRADLGKAG